MQTNTLRGEVRYALAVSVMGEQVMGEQAVGWDESSNDVVVRCGRAVLACGAGARCRRAMLLVRGANRAMLVCNASVGYLARSERRLINRPRVVGVRVLEYPATVRRCGVGRVILVRHAADAGTDGGEGAVAGEEKGKVDVGGPHVEGGEIVAAAAQHEHNLVRDQLRQKGPPDVQADGDDVVRCTCEAQNK